ncbi:HNH endonuclease [Rahnella sp. PCH160]|uniref:HNH endonuclease n=1 Tax=Rahnella sp. PCH160 TaxID=3447928 RepID=UPI0039FBBE60
MSRKPISKKVRFEVFKRDGFKCQYCGKSAPEIVLHADHIFPVSKGGGNDVLNMITSYIDCNLGKSDGLLSDTSIVKVQVEQLQQLNERREQLAMLISWRNEMDSIDNTLADSICEIINSYISPLKLNESGVRGCLLMAKKHPLQLIYKAIDIAFEKTLSDVGVIDGKTATAFFDYIPRVINMLSKPDAVKRSHYIRGILRNRVCVNENLVMDLISAWVEAGNDVNELEGIAKCCRSWTDFRLTVERKIYGGID